MAGATGWSAAPDGDGDVAGVMMITEWDGIGEEFKANRWAIAMQRALIACVAFCALHLAS